MTESEAVDAEVPVMKNLEFGSDDTEPLMCDPCGVDGSDVFADGYCQTCTEYLCRGCYDCHCKPKPMRHHVLLDAGAMPKSKPSVEQNEDSTEKCLKHEMPLKVFCKTHSDLGCILCLSEEHTSCGDVSFLQDCAKGVNSSKEYQDFKSKVESLKASLQKEMREAENHAESVDKEFGKVNTTEAVSLLTVALHDIMKREETKLEMQNNARQLIKSVIGRCELSFKQLDGLLSSESSEVLQFIKMKRSSAVITQTESCLETVRDDNKATGGLKSQGLEGLSQCTSILKYVQTCLEAPAEEAEISKQVDTPPKNPPKEPNTPDKVKGIDIISTFTIKIDVVDEDMDCRITGCTVLNIGALAFTDFCNKSIKVVYPFKRHKIVSMELNDKPFDVAEMQPGKLAVTLPAQREICMLSLKKENLSIDRSINVGEPCYGIDSSGNLLYIAIERPPKVKVMNPQGQVLSTFANDGNGQALFNSPWYIALDPSRDRMYVTDRNRDTLTCLTKQGDVVRVVKSPDMVRPYGVTVDKSGMIYVCARRVDKLVCLDPDFQLLKVVEEDNDLHKAETVVAWSKLDRLYIGLYRKDELTVIDLHKVKGH